MDINKRFISRNKILKDAVNNNKLVFIQSPTGTGKTTFISNLNLKNTLFISVNRTNCSQMYISFRKKGKIVKPYIPIEKQKTPHSSIVYTEMFFKNLTNENVIINALSLHRVGDLKWDTIVIDEISSLLGSIVEPIFNINPINHMLAIQSLLRLLKQANNIICLDGYINKNTIKLYSELVGVEAVFYKNVYKCRKCAKLVKLNSTSSSKLFKPETPSVEYFYNRFNEACKNRTKFLCSSTTRKLIDDLYSFIMTNYGDLLLEGKAISLTPNNIKFYEERGLSINDLTKNPILLLYSPVVVTALDIKNFENEEVYHIINRNHMSSIANYQMINRARNTMRVVVFLPEIAYKKTSIKPFKNIIFDIFKDKDVALKINKSYKEKFHTYFVNLAKYLVSVNLKEYDNFILDIKNRRLNINKDKRDLIVLAHYHYKSIKNDCNNSVAYNLIKLLKSEGYSLEEIDESKDITSVKRYRNNLQFKIENHFKMENLNIHNNEVLSIVKFCQYLYLTGLYKHVKLNDKEYDQETYDILVKSNIPDYARRALLTSSNLITKIGFINNRMDKIRSIFYSKNLETINIDLKNSVINLTPQQQKLYGDICKK